MKILYSALSILTLTNKSNVHGELLRTSLEHERDLQTQVSDVGMHEDNYDEYCVPVNVCNKRDIPISFDVSFDVQNTPGDAFYSKVIPPGQCIKYPCTKNYHFFYRGEEVGGDSVWSDSPCDIAENPNLCWKRKNFDNKARGYFLDLEYLPQVSNVFQPQHVGVHGEDYNEYCVPIHVCNKRNLLIRFDIQNHPGPNYITADIPPGECAEYPCTKNYYFYYRGEEIGGTAVYSASPCDRAQNPRLCWNMREIQNKGRGYYLDLDYYPSQNYGY